jgi:hypothetical protein
MEILLLVCAATIAPADCQVATATHVMRPTLAAAAGAPAGCLRDGLLYAAESGLVTAGHYAKVFCRAGAAVPGRAAIQPVAAD